MFVGCSPAHMARIFLLPASMLKDKGFVEFLEEARHLKAVTPDRRFVLAGAAIYDNPQPSAWRSYWPGRSWVA
jgi:hypothetical protein